MSHRVISSPIVIALAALLTLSSWNELQGQTRFWLTADVASGGSAQVASEIEVLLGEPTEIALWAMPSTTLENFSLNVVSTSETVLQFDSVEVDNGDGSNRFEFVFDTPNGLVVGSGFCDYEDIDFDTLPTHAIWDLRGFTIDDSNGTGLVGEETGTQLATISLTGLELGSTDLYLQIGEIGVNEVGSTTTLTEVSFGNPADAHLNADLETCVNSATSEATISVVETLTAMPEVEQVFGDFNDDGLVDATDIDLLSAEVLRGTNDSFFDLNGDTRANALDRVFWVNGIKNTIFGDANLDRSVSFGDFLLLRDSYPGPGGWANGDFDGDAAVGFTDFLLLQDVFGTSLAAEHSVSEVPEPNGLLLALLASIFVWRGDSLLRSKV